MPKAATKPKRDHRISDIVKYLTKQGEPVHITDLLLATALKGLKKVSDKVREEFAGLINADERVLFVSEDEDLVGLAEWYPKAKTELAPGEDDPPPTSEVPTLGEMLAKQEANGQPAVATKISEPISTAPTPEAAAPLTDDEKHNLLFKAMVEHQDKGSKLAAEFFDLKREEMSQDGALKVTRETIKELQKTMAGHMAAVPTLESYAQKKIHFDVGGDANTGGPEPDAWRYNVPADQIIPLDQIPDLTFYILGSRLRVDLPYQSELHQIGSDVIEVKGSRYLLRESSEDERRWFAQPVVTKDEWQQLLEKDYGRAVKDFDQNDEAADTRKKGGEDCGRMVKVSRSQAVLGPESQGIVITVPDAMLPVPEGATRTGKDAAAGSDQDEENFG